MGLSMRWKKRRGSAWAWAVALVSIFAIGIFYIVYFYSYYFIKAELTNSTIFNQTSLPKKAQDTIDFGELVMTWYPLFAYIGILAWAMVYSITKRERSDVFNS